MVEEDWHRLYLRAWRVLRYDRQYDAFGGQSQITFRAIDAYARRYGIQGDDFDTLLRAVTALDREWLEHVAEQQDKAKDQ